MIQFVAAVRKAVADENHHAALALALALPDMCGAIAYPEMQSGDRYRCWWARYMEHRFTFALNDGVLVLLGGGDAWALRCAYLHLGSDNIERQRAAEALDKFRFVSQRNGLAHVVHTGRHLQLNAAYFCEDIVTGVEQFLADARQRDDWRAALDGFMDIVELDPAPA